MASKQGPSPHVHVERRSDLVRIDELRAIFRLEGELWELPGGSEQQRLRALEGLCALVGAQVGIWGSFEALAREGGFLRRTLHVGWGSDRDRAIYLDYLRDGQERLPDPTIGSIAKAMNEPVSTFIRAQLITDGEWYRSAHVEEYRRTCGVDSFLHSVRAHRDAGYVISLHRPWGQRPFSERERRLVDLFHRESSALVPRSPRPALAPYLERTLGALLRGLSEKQAAAELGLSQHTVHEYVQALYRRFEVGSRAELFARLAGSR